MEPFPLPSALPDPDETLDLILESLSELVDYELAVVLGLGRDGDLRVRKARGPLYDSRLEGFRIHLDRRRDLQDVMDSGKPRIFGDENHVDTYHEVLDLPPGHSCLAVPLAFQGHVLGLLTFDHRSCGKFSPSILSFTAMMARLVAMILAWSDRSRELALSNIRLVEERGRLLEGKGGGLARLVGDSPAWRQVKEVVRIAASADVPVLVRGETGTGKEGVARALHEMSSRAGGPFIALNCSALGENLAESELFGHEKGAFTGADRQRKGRFELAQGGTLFLDEIGDLPRSLQPKLLRVIQEGIMERVGGERPVEVDVRIIAATHVDLEDAIRKGLFRQDLYYRLEVFPIHLPGLADRREDIPLLALHFLAHGIPGNVSISSGALAWLEEQEWPGNVRQLRNLLERAALLARGGYITREHLEGRDGNGRNKTGGCTDAVPEGSGASRSTPVLTWDEGSRSLITDALHACEGHIYGPGGAAALLGLKPSTLQGKMRRLGMAR